MAGAGTAAYTGEKKTNNTLSSAGAETLVCADPPKIMPGPYLMMGNNSKK